MALPGLSNFVSTLTIGFPKMKTLSQILRLLVLASLSISAHAQVVDIPDPALNAAIRAAGKCRSSLLTQ